MADDGEQLRSDKEGEDTDAEMQEQATASRYNLRPRQTIREQELTHQTSPLFRLMNPGELENDSAALMDNLRRTLAATEAMLTAPSASVTTAAAGLARREFAEGGRNRGTRTQSLHVKTPVTTEGLPWMDYHRLFGQRVAEGERAMEALSRPAVDSSNEVVVQLHPRPSLDEGHT